MSWRKKVLSYKNLCVYFTYLLRSPPHTPIYMKFCMSGHLGNVINRAKFYLN